MHLLAFSRDEVQTGRVAQGTRPTSEPSGCSWLSLHALSGSLWASVHIWSDPPSPFYSLLLPFLLAFHFFSVSPTSFYKSFMYLLWLLRVFVAFCSCCERGLLFIVVCGPLIVVVSLVAERGLKAHRLSGCPAACGIFLDQGLNPCPLP